VVASFRKPGKHTDARAQATGNSLRRVIPIIIAQQIVEEQGARSVNVPIEAHILAVADAYQKLIGGPDGKGMSPVQASSRSWREAGQKYDRGVVDAFATAMGATRAGRGRVKAVLMLRYCGEVSAPRFFSGNSFFRNSCHIATTRDFNSEVSRSYAASLASASGGG